jgi:hypothetical protein
MTSELLNSLMAHLPVRDTEQEFDPSQYEAQSERPPKLKAGAYLCNIIADPTGYPIYEDGEKTNQTVPLLFDYPKWAPDFLRATLTVAVVGRFERQGGKDVVVNDVLPDTRIRYQSLSTEPSWFKEDKDVPKLMRLIKALQHKDKLLVDADWMKVLASAMEFGTEFKAIVSIKRDLKTAKINKDTGKAIYVKFGTRDFDDAGELQAYIDDGSKVLGEPDPNREIVTVVGYPEVVRWLPYTPEA